MGPETGSDTIIDTETSSGVRTETLTEDLGADGTIIDGAEYDSVSEAQGHTITETDLPIGTLAEGASNVAVTLSNTITHSETDNETDQEWATETLGTSGTIAGGSDCFTISDLETSAYTSTGTGPENYNDTSSTPNGTAMVTGSGSSSSSRYQRFGDVLGTGGDITRGSLTYTVTSSETDAATTIESGTETLADPTGPYGDPAQAASYGVTTTMPDYATAWETGTESLGSGGTISGGTASFSWGDGDSLTRHLTVSGIAAILSVTEDSTDTYGFGESGTETMTTDGVDLPGSVSFSWEQMGTDAYILGQSNSQSITAGPSLISTSYTRTLSDTTSSSWSDTGVDQLGTDDLVTGESDTYLWNERVSDSLSVAEFSVSSGPSSSSTEQYSGVGWQFEQSSDAGVDSLTPAGPGTDSLVTATSSVTYSITQAWADSPDAVYTSDDTSGDHEAATAIGSDAYNGIETGWSADLGTSNQISDSYAVSAYEDLSTSVSVADGGAAPLNGSGQALATYHFYADGTDSEDTVSHRTLDFQEQNLVTGTNSESWSTSEGGGIYDYADQVDSGRSESAAFSGDSTMNGAYSGWSDVLNGYYQDDSLNEHGSDATGGTWADGYTHDDKDSTEIFSENTTSGSTDTIIPYHDDDTTYGGSSNRCCPLLPTAPTRAPANDVGGSSMAAPLYGAVYQVNQSNADAPYINTGSATVESGYGPYGRSAFPTSLLPYRFQERDTDNQTAAGLLSWGTSEVVAHAAPPPPTAVLTALTALGRDPTDRILPTAGSEAADPPPEGSHLTPEANAAFAYLADTPVPPPANPNPATTVTSSTLSRPCMACHGTGYATGLTAFEALSPNDQAAVVMAGGNPNLAAAGKKLVLGEWSDEPSALGEAGQILTGLTLLDTVADIRDGGFDRGLM